MKLALMQPYFFPYLGYYTIMKHVDIYIYLDNVQYIKNGWINRNRILKTNGGWNYITVPIHKFHTKDLINEIIIANDVDWQTKIKSQLMTYKKFAPNFKQVYDLVNELFSKNFDKIFDLNLYADKLIRKYLGIKTKVNVLSLMNLNYENPYEADEWGLNVCKAIPNVTEYWNAPGGKLFFNTLKYSTQGIKVNFIKQHFKPYFQNKNESFIESLSILDVMMFCSVEEINDMLNDFEIIC